MSTYTVKNAILDLGFIDGCLQPHIHGGSPCEKYIWEVLDRIEERIAMQNLGSGQMLYDLGIVRGAMWLTPLPGAYSDAMDRLMEFFTHGKVDWYQLPQPFTGREHEDPVLSDAVRDQIYTDYVIESREYAAETARLAGFDREFIIDRIVPPRVRHPEPAKIPESGVENPLETEAAPEPEKPEPELSAIRSERLAGRPQWTPEQRAAQAERARNQHKNRRPFESDLPAVKADWEAGLSFRAIGRKWGCSEAHIRNFLTKHGIDPKRPKPTLPEYESIPRSEYEWTDESRARLLAMHADGTPWDVIGAELGRTPAACRSMFHLLAKQEETRPEKADPVPVPAITTEDIPEVQDMLDRNLSYDDIGEWFGCDAETVRQFCQDHRLVPANWREQVKKRSEEQQAELASQTVAADKVDAITKPPPESPASRWKPNPLSLDDWADIQGMLAKGRTREAIASDYDVPLDDLNAYIEERLEETRNRRVTKEPPPGEASAPLH